MPGGDARAEQRQAADGRWLLFPRYNTTLGEGNSIKPDKSAADRRIAPAHPRPAQSRPAARQSGRRASRPIPNTVNDDSRRPILA